MNYVKPRLEAPSFAFDPTDPWTETFQIGLWRAGLQGRHVYEVGIGTGTNAVFLLDKCDVASASGSDIDPRLTMLAIRNVAKLAPERADRFRPVEGAVSLIDTDDARTAISAADVVIACLPQVGCPTDKRLARVYSKWRGSADYSVSNKSDDHYAHYYPWSAFDEFPFNAVGLGLNQALLQQLKVYAPRAEVIMNIGCRVGHETILNFFRANGYEPECLHTQIVRQHKETSIAFFVSIERILDGTGFEKEFACEFYADRDGGIRLSARKAEALLAESADAELFHEVSTFRCRSLGNARIAAH
ncbi:class I SAM-dependent methyltransferase (plasmid) [Rhizobium lusitanum]|uniref:class I SAM-dependent methyltransferase n=1 Tax=Rhizobium lusitanum TaxID=293958 RepID=UPI00161A3E7E|nr:class I SAM-dependent methyltransferase [Rhizobium lusitanum]QND44764.1 class I SAM-dependent methyltransferase [Rhizobium lusitanum]